MTSRIESIAGEAAPLAMPSDSSAAVTAVPAAAVDFQREVFCVLGLPIGAIDMAGAVARVRSAAASNTPCMVSTPNLNFLVNALSDPAFRASVADSDLSLADGMPMVWVARLLGLPLRERVSGAGLFEALADHPGAPVAVFFFGGPDGVAEAACQRVNASSRGLRCVGFDSPGFGSIEQMSDDDRVARINASGAQFVIAALGAKKGQAWLQHNRGRLSAPLLCHLGAVVNFAAGTVRRAPPVLQRLGLEWLWRIVEEPALWRRYGSDGLAFVRLLFTCVLPLRRALRAPPAAELARAMLTSEVRADTCTLTLRGAWTRDNLQPLRAALAKAASQARRLKLVLREVSQVDSAFIGLVMLAPRAFALGVELVAPTAAVLRTLRLHRAESLLANGGRDA